MLREFGRVVEKGDPGTKTRERERERERGRERWTTSSRR